MDHRAANALTFAEICQAAAAPALIQATFAWQLLKDVNAWKPAPILQVRHAAEHAQKDKHAII
jgi:hypothetical protein